MRTETLSESAIALLRRRLSGERVEVTDETRPFYRELVDAGMMIPLHTFALGPNSAYRLTDAACDLRDGRWNGSTFQATPPPSA
jgi:hypothetical protein